MDEATLFKFGKWIDYGKSHRRGEKFPWKGRGLGPVTLLKILYPFNISGMDEATLIKFGNWIVYGKSHQGVKISPRKRRGRCHVTL